MSFRILSINNAKKNTSLTGIVTKVGPELTFGF